MRLHRFAVATVFATLVLLVAGGLVSTTGSGLACPDWPLCEGQYLPPMQNGKEYEHTHRLIASFVLVMTFGLTALLFKHRREDRALQRLGVVAALGVGIQALFGALTVWFRLPPAVSSTHLAIAMLFLSLLVTLAFLTRQRMPGARFHGLKPAVRLPLMGYWGAAIALIYLQIVGGAVMRHVQGGLACGHELLTCLGEVWPAHSFIGVHAHLVHRYLGITAGIAVVLFAGRLLCAAPSHRALRRLAFALVTGVVAQVVLGFWTVLSSRRLEVVNTHSTLAALLLVGLVSAYWLMAPSRPPNPVTQAR
ncbi:MAG: COX15/CtaA family protein [Myxococcota bacterium]|nr:COX15/CtaA family protein [Myxococcota bacterium]